MEESLWILEGKAFEAKGTTSVEAWWQQRLAWLRSSEEVSVAKSGRSKGESGSWGQRVWRSWGRWCMAMDSLVGPSNAFGLIYLFFNSYIFVPFLFMAFG